MADDKERPWTTADGVRVGPGDVVWYYGIPLSIYENRIAWHYEEGDYVWTPMPGISFDPAIKAAGYFSSERAALRAAIDEFDGDETDPELSLGACFCRRLAQLDA